MSLSLTRVLKFSALAAAFGLTVGCATTDADVSAAVEEARQEAAAANQLANEAMTEARAARETANEALEKADMAQISADRAIERQERMIQRGMYK